MQFSELKNELDAGKIRNLYIFTGPEREVMNKYIKRIDGNPVRAKTFESIVNHLTTKGLFAKRKTYVIEDDKGVLDMELETIKKLIGGNTVILLFNTVDNRVSFFKQVKDLIVTFERFNEGQLVWYVRKYLPDIDDQTALILARYCGNDVARLENECHKLSFLGEPVTVDIIQDMIEPPLEDRIFDMIDYAAMRKPEQVFDIYYDLLEMKESPIKIVSLLYTKFKQIFLVQSLMGQSNQDIAAKTGMTFWQVNKAKEMVGIFTVDELLNFMLGIQTAEVAMKTGEMDQYLAMEHLFLGILRR